MNQADPFKIFESLYKIMGVSNDAHCKCGHKLGGHVFVGLIYCHHCDCKEFELKTL